MRHNCVFKISFSFLVIYSPVHRNDRRRRTVFNCVVDPTSQSCRCHNIIILYYCHPAQTVFFNVRSWPQAGDRVSVPCTADNTGRSPRHCIATLYGVQWHIYDFPVGGGDGMLYRPRLSLGFCRPRSSIKVLEYNKKTNVDKM